MKKGLSEALRRLAPRFWKRITRPVYDRGYSDGLLEGSLIADQMAWTNRNSALLGPEQNCAALSKLLRTRAHEYAAETAPRRATG